MVLHNATWVFVTAELPDDEDELNEDLQEAVDFAIGQCGAVLADRGTTDERTFRVAHLSLVPLRTDAMGPRFVVTVHATMVGLAGHAGPGRQDWTEREAAELARAGRDVRREKLAALDNPPELG